MLFFFHFTNLDSHWILITVRESLIILRQLPEPIMILFTDAYVRHYAS